MLHRIEREVLRTKVLARDQTFGRVVEAHVRAVRRHPRHRRRERLPHEPLEILDELDLLRLARSLLGYALHVGGVLGDPWQRRFFLVELLRASADEGLEHTMHHKVGIAPDGRREMRVGPAGQAVVRSAVGTVHRPLHRPQQERRHELALGTLRARLQHALDDVRIARDEVGLIDVAEPREVLEHGHERRQAVGRRLLVDAVQAGELRIAQVLGDGLVRKDHGLFDERGRVGLDAQVDTRRTPLLIENHARLDRVEVEAARPLAGGEGRGRPSSYDALRRA